MWPWVLIALLLLAFLITGVIALAVIVGLSGGGSTGSASSAQWEESYVTGEGESQIAVLPVAGTITDSTSGGAFAAEGATPDALRSQLQQAEDNPDVEAVILEVNSPGGYYISAAADTIVANPSTTTGSIGVIFNYTNFEEGLDKIGVDPQPLTTGEFKDLGSPADELSEDEREILNTQIEQSYDEFVAAIVEGRDSLSEERVRELGDGRTYTGEQAADNGLVDELGGIETAAAEARELADIEQAEVVRYEESPGIFESVQARIAPEEPEAVQIMESAGIEPTPEMQYLYRPGW